jgi:hypothetical protein
MVDERVIDNTDWYEREKEKKTMKDKTREEYKEIIKR